MTLLQIRSENLSGVVPFDSLGPLSVLTSRSVVDIDSEVRILTQFGKVGQRSVSSVTVTGVRSVSSLSGRDDKT